MRKYLSNKNLLPAALIALFLAVLILVIFLRYNSSHTQTVRQRCAELQQQRQAISKKYGFIAEPTAEEFSLCNLR